MEKSEILEMPEGKSSEEIDALMMDGEEEAEQSDDSGLAKEALEATKESSPAEESVKGEEKPEETEEQAEETELSETEQQLRAKDSKIASMKHEHRDLELENAELKGELKARHETHTTPEEDVKSPLDLAEAEYTEENGDLEGFTMSGDLYRRQKAFDDEQTTKSAESDSKKTADTAMDQAALQLREGELSAEKMGKGLDLKTVVKIGEQYLTEGDLLDISNTANSKGNTAGIKQYYRKILQRTLATKNEDATVLQNAINAKGKKSQAKPEKKKTDIDALITEGEEQGEAETGTSEKLESFLGPDFFG